MLAREAHSLLRDAISVLPQSQIDSAIKRSREFARDGSIGVGTARV